MDASMKCRMVVFGILPLLLLAGAAGCGRRESPPESTPPAASTSADALFDDVTVPRIEIEIARPGLRALRRTQWGHADERPEARATVREGGVVYRNVALHLKGAAGSFRPVDDRPAMTLKFDKYEPGQTFHGLGKISLNNSVQDPSCLSEKICRELFLAAGVPVPRAGHALVKLNGRDLGLYVLLEGANKQFLKRHFANADGNLFDGGFVRDVHESLAVNSGKNRENRSGLTKLLEAERASRQSRSLAPLEEALDVDRFLSMLAMEVIIRHWDGYGLNKNNWRLFHNLDSGKMVFIPHGIDQTFGVGEHHRGRILTGIEPVQWQGRMALAVMRTAEGRRRYRQRVAELSQTVFQADRILARIDEVQARLSPVLAAWNRSAARNQERDAASLKRRILRRSDELKRQLPSRITPGSAKPSGRPPKPIEPKLTAEQKPPPAVQSR